MKKRITIVVVAALALPLSLAASVFGGGDIGLERPTRPGESRPII